MRKNTLSVMIALGLFLIPLTVFSESADIKVIDTKTTVTTSIENNTTPESDVIEPVVEASNNPTEKNKSEQKLDEKTQQGTDNDVELSVEKSAEKSVEKSTVNKTITAHDTPEVGKHVRTANMNPGSMILSLFMVLGLIIVCALVLKRFNLTKQSVSQLKVITSLRLGTKEQVMVVQVGEQQLLLGVTSQQITLLDTLSEPLSQQGIKPEDLPKNILSFLAPKIATK